jgi:hypothetical protein
VKTCNCKCTRGFQCQDIRSRRSKKAIRKVLLIYIYILTVRPRCYWSHILHYYYYYLSFPQGHCSYSLALEVLKLHTLRMRRHRLDALLLTQVYFSFKFCPSVLEIVGLRVPARYIRDIALFNVCSSCKNYPSARCASAANVVCRDVDVFGARNVLLNRFL